MYLLNTNSYLVGFKGYGNCTMRRAGLEALSFAVDSCLPRQTLKKISEYLDLPTSTGG